MFEAWVIGIGKKYKRNKKKRESKQLRHTHEPRFQLCMIIMMLLMIVVSRSGRQHDPWWDELNWKHENPFNSITTRLCGEGKSCDGSKSSPSSMRARMAHVSFSSSLPKDNGGSTTPRACQNLYVTARPCPAIMKAHGDSTLPKSNGNKLFSWPINFIIETFFFFFFKIPTVFWFRSNGAMRDCLEDVLFFFEYSFCFLIHKMKRVKVKRRTFPPIECLLYEMLALGWHPKWVIELCAKSPFSLRRRLRLIVHILIELMSSQPTIELENVSKRQMVKSFHDSLISVQRHRKAAQTLLQAVRELFTFFSYSASELRLLQLLWAVFAVCGNWMTLHWLGALDSQLCILSSCVDSSGIVVQLPRQRRRLDLTILNLIFHYYFASFTAKK